MEKAIGCYSITFTNGELYHHGVKGMHWGIRRRLHQKSLNYHARKAAYHESAAKGIDPNINKAHARASRIANRRGERHRIKYEDLKRKSESLYGKKDASELNSSADKVYRDEYIKGKSVVAVDKYVATRQRNRRIAIAASVIAIRYARKQLHKANKADGVTTMQRLSSIAGSVGSTAKKAAGSVGSTAKKAAGSVGSTAKKAAGSVSRSPVTAAKNLGRLSVGPSTLKSAFNSGRNAAVKAAKAAFDDPGSAVKTYTTAKAAWRAVSGSSDSGSNGRRSKKKTSK